MLSERRDEHAARMFLRRVLAVADSRPQRITTDLHPAHRRAIRWIIGRKARHWTAQYLNNYTEQSHRGVTQRYYPMLGFGSFESASRFCAAFDELRQVADGTVIRPWPSNDRSSSIVGARSLKGLRRREPRDYRFKLCSRPQES